MPPVVVVGVLVVVLLAAMRTAERTVDVSMVRASPDVSKAAFERSSLAQRHPATRTPWPTISPYAGPIPPIPADSEFKRSAVERPPFGRHQRVAAPVTG